MSLENILLSDNIKESINENMDYLLSKIPEIQYMNVRHFKNHAIASARISESVLRRLNYAENYIKYICYLIEYHDTPICNEQIIDNYDRCLKLYEIQRCDALAHHPNQLEKRKKYLEETGKKLLLSKPSDFN